MLLNKEINCFSIKNSYINIITYPFKIKINYNF